MVSPTWVDTANFAAGAEDITADGRDRGWRSARGTTSIVTSGFVADAGRYSSILTNRHRNFDPLFASGAYYPNVVPGVGFQKVATFAATPYEVFTGFADEWPQFYPMSGYDQTVDFRCSDAIASLAQASLNITRPAERTGTRIDAIITATGWAGPTATAPGTSIVGPMRSGVTSAWSALQDTCQVEWGELYVAADGTLTFRDRNEIATATRSTVSQATFTDGSGLKYADVTMGSPPIVNDCTVTFNDRGDTENFQDAVSMAEPWGTRSLNVSLPFHTGADARAYARWIVQLYGTPVTTFTSLTLKPGKDPANLFPQVLGRELGDMITVTRTPGVDTGNGQLVPSTAITKTCWIRGIQHEYADGVWKSTDFYLQDAGWPDGLALFDSSDFDGPDVFGL